MHLPCNGIQDIYSVITINSSTVNNLYTRAHTHERPHVCVYLHGGKHIKQVYT